MKVETSSLLTSDILLWPNSSPRKLKRKQLILVLVSEDLVRYRRKEWKKGLQPNDQEAEKQGDWLVLCLSFFPFYLIQMSSWREGVTHPEGGSFCISYISAQALTHRETSEKIYFNLLDDFTVKLTTKTNQQRSFKDSSWRSHSQAYLKEKVCLKYIGDGQ